MLHSMVRRGFSFSGHERNCVFLNTGQPRFADVSGVSGLDFADDGRGVAVVDWDLDGDQDFWIVNRSGPQLRFLRNELPAHNHYLALRLEGTTCNRDAIGARVEVVLGGRTLIKTLRAGEGYLAQSSKWLHFGLGDKSSIQSVTVRWPGGNPETFPEIRPDRRYYLKQGSGRAQRWKPPSRKLKIKASTLNPERARDSIRHLLPLRPPLPGIDCLDAAGSNVVASVNEGRPTLVNLWASWCAPCVSELQEWSAHADQLRSTGLDILLLSVDGLAVSGQSAPEDARRFLDSIGWPFQSGRATAATLDKLELLQQQLFDFHFPFSVPTSILVDGDGGIAVIYRGPVSTEQLLADVDELESRFEERLAQSIPFRGRWAFSGKYPVGDFAKQFEGRFPEEELRYLGFEISDLEKDLSGPRSTGAERQYLESQLYSLRLRYIVRLVQHGHLEKAERQCGLGLAVKPGSVQLRVFHAEILLRAGRIVEAVEIFHNARSKHPELARFDNLAPLLNSLELRDRAARELVREAETDPSRRPEEVLALFEHAAAIHPDFIPAHFGLAQALFAAGRREEAQHTARRALALARKAGDTGAEKKAEAALRAYEAGKPWREDGMK